MPFEALKGGRKPQHLTTKACNSIRTPGVKSLSYTSKGMITDPKREARLVLRAQSGDREALELVLCNVQASLLRYISGVVGRSGAEDVLQEVFLKICRNLKWLREPRAVSPLGLSHCQPRIVRVFEARATLGELERRDRGRMRVA
jgi:hypothetical protein